MNNILSTGDLIVRPIADNELDSTLEVYRESEDFLALGPVATASLSMVTADIEHSAAESGIYCGIWRDGTQIGVLDFVPEARAGTSVLSLLMIARPYRDQGIGGAILDALVTYLRDTYGTTILEGGVQTNNPAAIRFWQRHGFEIGSQARDLDDGTAAYSMTRRIASA